MLTDPFQDDLLPPKPTAAPATEVRRAPAKKPQSNVAQARPVQTAPRSASPYKIVSDPTASSYFVQPSNRQRSMNAEAAGSHSCKAPGQSVLRRTSAEQEAAEPAQFQIDRSGAAPIIRSQSPDDVVDYAIPHNPLRR